MCRQGPSSILWFGGSCLSKVVLSTFRNSVKIEKLNFHTISGLCFQNRAYLQQSGFKSQSPFYSVLQQVLQFYDKERHSTIVCPI